MSDLIDDKMLSDWRSNYGLVDRTPAEAMRWWHDRMDGKAPAGAVAALGLCIGEIERLRAVGVGYSQQTVDALSSERDRLRDERDDNAWWRKELADKLHERETEISSLRAALIAAMEIVQRERVRVACNAKDALTSTSEAVYIGILRRLDAVIAQADSSIGREG
mgnify:CR=1 FL=1